MIEFQNVSKSYRSWRVKKVILENCSGQFPRGRNVGLLGVNGSGKSTLIRLISGVEFPDRGRVKRNVRISYPLGFAGLKGNMTGRENCRFVARLYGKETRKVERFVEEFADLGPYFDMPAATYSSGMRSRLSFAVSMSVDFECYLIDEALSVADSKLRRRAEAIFAAKRASSSLIIVSHSPAQIRQFCDMGAVLHGGKLRIFNELEDAIAAYEQIAGKFKD